MTKFALAFLFAALAVAPVFIAQFELQENGEGAEEPGPAPAGGRWARLKRKLGAD